MSTHRDRSQHVVLGVQLHQATRAQGSRQPSHVAARYQQMLQLLVGPQVRGQVGQTGVVGHVEVIQTAQRPDSVRESVIGMWCVCDGDVV